MLLVCSTGELRAQGIPVVQAPDGSITIEAGAFTRHGFTDPANAARVQKSGSLNGGGGPLVNGWVEYAFTVIVPGWHTLAVAGDGAGIDFTIEPASANGGDSYRFHGTLGTPVPGEQRVGNIWLQRGAYRLRAERHFWTGFPHLSRFVIQRSSAAPQQTMHMELSPGARVFRAGECLELSVHYGPRAADATMELVVRSAWGKAVQQRLPLRLPASDVPTRVRARIPCERAGAHYLTLALAQGGELPWNEMVHVRYDVVSARRGYADLFAGRRTLVATVDAVRQPPDFFGGGAPRLVSSPAGEYRESGSTGWVAFQRLPEALRNVAPEPSWFAYRIEGLVPQTPYLVEIEYPDDAERTFGVAMRESEPLNYPVAVAVDTGGDFPLSMRLNDRQFIYWPRTSNPRLLVVNAYDDRRAALARARIYQIDAEPALRPPLPAGTRAFVHWYEEGLSFASLFGPPDMTPAGLTTAIERWFDLLASSGTAIVIPSVQIYSFSLYPSRFNQQFSGGPESDYLRRMLLLAEQRGIRVIPELHPRSDELTWPVSADPANAPQLARSKDGNTGWFVPGTTRRKDPPPLHNPLNPKVRDWYIGSIGELSDEFARYPALQGVALRVMYWSNPGLNNFGSLDWGYDAATVTQFERETGIQVTGRAQAGGEAAAAKLRHALLTGPHREQWIAWRARKITELIAQARDRVRKSRKDLVLYLTVFEAVPPPGVTNRTALLEMGIDVAALEKLDGVVLVNGVPRYGRAEIERIGNIRFRERTLDTAQLGFLASAGVGARFIPHSAYLEATEAVVSPSALGFPKSTRLTWMSFASAQTGRHMLERFAIPLAEYDALWLGDGGNNYTFGAEPVRQFANEFRLLPAIRFDARPDARDPAAVWTSSQKDAYWFYVVNRERYPVQVNIRLSGTNAVERVVQGKSLSLAGDLLQIELEPYGLAVFRAKPTARIGKVDVSTPAESVAHVRALISWAEARLKRSRQPRFTGQLSINDRALLERAVEDASKALSEGAYWRARTRFDRSELYAVYARIGEAPPGHPRP